MPETPSHPVPGTFVIEFVAAVSSSEMKPRQYPLVLYSVSSVGDCSDKLVFSFSLGSTCLSGGRVLTTEEPPRKLQHHLL